VVDPEGGQKGFTPIKNQFETFLKANGLSYIIRSKQRCGWMQNAAAVVQIIATTSQFDQKTVSECSFSHSCLLSSA
jgi:hypothetical protein